MDINRRLTWIFGAAFVYFIIYIYFLPLRTEIIYGDDLNIFMNFSGLHHFHDKINLDVPYGKFRPLHDLAILFLIETFGKSLSYYYAFNVLIQAINTVILAMAVNIFLRSFSLSLLFGMLLGLSRFCFFNISQLFNGGALEGLAMTFFLLFLFILLKTLAVNGNSPAQKQRSLYLAILFANLSMYTHERYIVLFPFMVIVVLLYPGLKTLAVKQKLILSSAAIASVFLNIFIKKELLSLPFFVGTGGTNMSFSLMSPFYLLIDALLSVFQINSGPNYLAGISYSQLGLAEKILPSLLFLILLIVIVSYIGKMIRAFQSDPKTSFRDLHIVILLSLLFGLFMIPAVSTIRLEQRWLQGPLSIFLLMLGIALTHFRYKNTVVRQLLLTGFILIFLAVDSIYFKLGARNIYLVHAEKLASSMDSAVKKDIVHSNTGNLYIWEDEKNLNTEAEISWILGEGSFFDYYQGRAKQLIFVDSVYERSRAGVGTLKNFNEATDQILYINNSIVDIGNYYKKDSLKTIRQKIAGWAVAGKVSYNQRHMVIGINNFNEFATSGFYQTESNFRWTNGNAELGFIGDFKAKDTLLVLLNTFMPPVCKHVNPKISITDETGERHEPSLQKRVNDQFIYSFYFKSPVNLQKINIVSDTINSYPDKRVLSFPFLGMELNN